MTRIYPSPAEHRDARGAIAEARQRAWKLLGADWADALGWLQGRRPTVHEALRRANETLVGTWAGFETGSYARPELDASIQAFEAANRAAADAFHELLAEVN